MEVLYRSFIILGYIYDQFLLWFFYSNFNFNPKPQTLNPIIYSHMLKELKQAIFLLEIKRSFTLKKKLMPYTLLSFYQFIMLIYFYFLWIIMWRSINYHMYTNLFIYILIYCSLINFIIKFEFENVITSLHIEFS